jgi:hypothetical protein
MTILAFVLVIFGSIASGIVTVVVAYQLGRQSLSTVTTPSENPSQKIIKEEGVKKDFTIIDEKEILVKVYDFVQKQKQDMKNSSSN